MDMRKYSARVFRKPEDDDVREGPVQVVIAAIVEGKYERPDLEFDDGTRLSLNSTNNRVLMKAYGFDSDSWIGKKIELTVGPLDYEGKTRDSILVKPISPPVENKASKSDLGDDIPF